MGRFNSGILGGFSGKVGSVIGANWKGINYMRGRAAAKKKKKPSKAQLEQRLKFALTMRQLKPMTDFLRVSYKRYDVQQLPFNAAMSYALKNAIRGSFPDFSIDPAKMLVARGNLTVAANVQLLATGGSIGLSWTDNSGLGNASATDKALVMVWNMARAEVIYQLEGSQRASGAHALPVPVEWVGESVDVYLGFINEDATDLANSVYAGVVVVV